MASSALAGTRDPRALRVEERMERALGADALQSVATLGFDFVVRVDGEERLRRSHLWDRRTGRYRVEFPATDEGRCTAWFDLDAPDVGTVRCGGGPVGPQRKAELLRGAYRAFINDTWWLLMPFKWSDPGVNLTYIGPERSDRDRWDVVLLTFDEGTGLTDGDRYWAYVNRRTGRMDRWDMLLEKQEGEPTRVTWSGWETMGGVSLSTRKEIAGTDRSVAFENIQVLPDRHPEWFVPPPANPAHGRVAEQAGPVARPAAPHPSLPRAAPPAPLESRGESPPGTGNAAPRAEVRASAAPAAAAAPGPSTERPVRDLLVVVNKGDATAAIVDPESLAVLRTVPTGNGPQEVIVGPGGGRAFVANYGLSSPGHTITVIALPAGRVEATWDLGSYSRPHGMAFDPEGRLWVTAEGSGAVLALDASDGRVERVVETGQNVSHMVAVCPGAGKAFVTNIGSGTVTVVPLDGGPARRLQLGNGPEGIAAAPGAAEVWVTDRYENRVSVLDARTETVTGTVEAGEFPMRVTFTPDGSRALVTNVRGGDVWVYDRRTRRRIASHPAGTAPVGVLVPPSGDRFYVADTRGDTVRVFDLATGRALGEVRTGSQPEGMAWVPAKE